MTTPFKELAGSPVIEAGAGAVIAKRFLLVAWESRFDLVGELLGLGWTWGQIFGKQFPGFWWLAASRALIEPYDARPDQQGEFTDLTQNVNEYTGQLALVSVTYNLLPD